MKYFTIGLIVFLLLGCGANNKLRRAERLIKKAELAGAKWSIDTVYKEVPVFIDSVRVDSVFVAQVGDTVVIEKERLRLKYVRLPGDSVYIEAECEADTIYQKVPVTVTKTISAKSDWLKWLIIGFVGGCIFVMAVFMKRLLN